jgi:NAD+ diphosphatase
LAEWHRSARFCPECGAPTIVGLGGWVRHCAARGTELYPRTDPAMIVAVTDPRDRLLLSHSAAWPPGLWSVQAGFLEAGESLEGTVRREVHEEVGLDLASVEYLGSQAWPFQRSLRCAFRARSTGDDVRVDGEEVLAARWFTRAELADAVADGSVIIAPSSAIARFMIEDWFGKAFDVP